MLFSIGTGNSLNEQQEKMPFETLFSLLKSAGFRIGVRDLIEFYAIFENFKNEDLKGLKYYLAPVICKNPADQQTFYNVFDQWCVTIARNHTPKKKWTLLIRQWLRVNKYYFLALLAITIAVGLVVYQYINKPIKPHKICVNGALASVVNVRVGDTVTFDEKCGPVNRTNSADTIYSWNLGEGNEMEGNSATHVYTTVGEFSVYLKTVFKQDTARDTVKVIVCPKLEKLTISPVRPDSNTIVKIQLSQYKPATTRLAYWEISNPSNDLDTIIPYTAPVLNYKLLSSGTFQIALKDSSNKNCSLAEYSFAVTPVGGYDLNIVTQGKPDEQYYFLAGNSLILALLLSIPGTLIFFILRFILYKVSPPKSKLKPRLKTNALSKSGKNKAVKPPFDIPFNNNDQYIQPENKLFGVYNELQKTRITLFRFLDIPKTIRNTIQNHGLVSPVYKQHKKNYDYILLIEKDIGYHLQLSLFIYLANKFIHQNIRITYYDYSEPGIFKNAKQTQNYSLKKLKTDHPDAVLIIVGTGYSLLDSALPKIKKDFDLYFELWDNRLLVTPVLQQDWRTNELILAQRFILLPADLEGWVKLVQLIEEGSATSVYREWKNYNVNNIELEDIDELKKYINDDDVFQWICSLAIHHRIRWELIVGIGTEILSALGVSGKLNYSNLLKIARIPWIKDGVFPTELRLDLLKELTNSNEITARRKMLSMLKESDGLISVESFSFLEKQVQVYTDSFILYTYDPVANIGLKADADAFLALWRENRIVDVPLKIYLKNQDDKQSPPLKTLKNNKLPAGSNTLYLDKPPGLNLKNILIVLLALWSAFFLCELFAFGNDPGGFPNNITKGVWPIAESHDPPNIDITIKIDTGICLRQLTAKQNDSLLYIELKTPDTSYRQQLYLDPGVLSALPTQHVNEIVFKKVKVNGNNRIALYTSHKKILDGQLPLRYTKYLLSVSGSACNNAKLPEVYIQYDTAISSSTAELFRQCISLNGYVAEGTGQRNYKFVNVVRYLRPSMKSYAEALATVAERCLRTKFTTQLVALTGKPDTLFNDTTKLEIWISSTSECKTVTFDSIPNVVSGYKYFNSRMSSNIILYRDSIRFNTVNKNTYPLEKDIKYCGENYTFYLHDATRKKRDSIYLSFKDNNLNLLASDKNYQYYQLFDLKNYKRIKSISDKRFLGSWQRPSLLSASIEITPTKYTIISSTGTTELDLTYIYYDSKNRCYLCYSSNRFQSVICLKMTDSGIYLSFFNTPLNGLDAGKLYQFVSAFEQLTRVVKLPQTSRPDQATGDPSIKPLGVEQWFKVGYSLQIGSILIELNELNNGAGTVSIKLCQTSTAYRCENVINEKLNISLKRPYVFSYKDEKYTLTLTKIAKAGSDKNTLGAYVILTK